MAGKQTRILSDHFVYDTDGTTVLSAYRTEITEYVDDDGTTTQLKRRDVDMTPEELGALTGGLCAAHVTQTNARADAAEAQVKTLADSLTKLQAEHAALLADIEPVSAAPAQLTVQ